MASCDVEPLDLSMDNMHATYEKRLEGMMTSGYMKKKVEALAKDMSHFTYKDLWTECCRRYKDILKSMLGYDARAHAEKTQELVTMETIPEGDIAGCRKRKASGGSSDSGWSDDAALPLKKRHLRTEYLANGDDSSNQSPTPESEYLIDHSPKSQPPSEDTVDCCINNDLTADSQSIPKNGPSHCQYGYCDQSIGQERYLYQDRPCDLSTYRPVTSTAAVPGLPKYDNSESHDDWRGREPHKDRMGLLARLLTESKPSDAYPETLPVPYPVDYQGQIEYAQRYHHKSEEANLYTHPAAYHNTYEQGMPAHEAQQYRSVKPDLYASPYLNTSTDYGQYSPPSRRYQAPSGAESHTQSTQNSLTYPIKTVRLDGYAHSMKVNQGHPKVKPRTPNFREHHHDKVLKRLLQYGVSDESDNADGDSLTEKSVKESVKETTCSVNSRVVTSFWDVIEDACDKMAAI